MITDADRMQRAYEALRDAAEWLSGTADAIVSAQTRARVNELRAAAAEALAPLQVTGQEAEFLAVAPYDKGAFVRGAPESNAVVDSLVLRGLLERHPTNAKFVRSTEEGTNALRAHKKVKHA